MELRALLDIRILLPVLFSALYSLLWATAAWRAIRRGHFLLKALDDSTRSLAEVERSPTMDGFTATFVPAPEPFRTLVVTYQPAPAYNPLMLLPPLFKQNERMIIRGRLREPPSDELVWMRGHTPGVAATPGRHPQLWRVRHLDVWNMDYAVRGENTGAIENAFRELHARFSPLLMSMHLHNPAAAAPPSDEQIATARDDHFVLHLRVAQLGLHEVPPLIATVRTAGRAALL
jgi:hypothetical protein